MIMTDNRKEQERAELHRTIWNTANPPYSIKWAGDENPLLINDPRFSPAGVLIAEQDYNISVGAYIEQEDKRKIIDVKLLNAEIEQIVAREDVLRRKIAAIIAKIERAA